MNAQYSSADRKLTLAVVDDDPSVIRLVRKVLDTQFPGRMEIHSFTDPREARDWLSVSCCDLLLLDIVMPHVDGLELLQHAKRRNAWTQAILLTAYSTCDRLLKAVDLGAIDYLLKPIDHDLLTDVIEHEIARFGRWQKALYGTMDAVGS